MKKYPALAITEYESIPAGMYLSDIMVKESPISLFKCGTISQGRYLSLIGGTTAAVDMAIEEARHADKNYIIDHVFLPDIHPVLHDAILGARQTPNNNAVAIIETKHVPCNVRASELVLKSTPVELLEIRLADHALHGKAVSIFQGELHDIEEAVEQATNDLTSRNFEHKHFILTAPHEATLQQIACSTAFHDVSNLELDGEI